MDVIKPHDVVVLLHLSLEQRRRRAGVLGVPPAIWNYISVANALRMSTQTVHAGLQTAAKARLFDLGTRYPIALNLLEFLVHGVKYCFPARAGETTRGMPTSSWASPLVSKIQQSSEAPLVWPYPEGQVVGRALEPLHRAVPFAAQRDDALKELLVLVDAIREGNPRVAAIAVDELQVRLKN